MPLFIATNLANGTVKSNLNPKSLFPWSVSLNVSFIASDVSPAANFAERTSYLSTIGVSIGA